MFGLNWETMMLKTRLSLCAVLFGVPLCMGFLFRNWQPILHVLTPILLLSLSCFSRCFLRGAWQSTLRHLIWGGIVLLAAELCFLAINTVGSLIATPKEIVKEFDRQTFVTHPTLGYSAKGPGTYHYRGVLGAEEVYERTYTIDTHLQRKTMDCPQAVSDPGKARVL